MDIKKAFLKAKTISSVLISSVVKSLKNFEKLLAAQK